MFEAKLDEINGELFLSNDYGMADLPEGRKYYNELESGDKVSWHWADSSRGVEELEIVMVGSLDEPKIYLG